DDTYVPPADGSDPVAGETAYMTGNLVGGANCVDCHSLPSGENGVIIPNNALLEPQDMVVPQLRNMYEKTRFDNTLSSTVRGFGFTHDGAVDDLVSFLQFPAFNFADDNERRDVASFLMAFDTGTHPAVGAQWTMDGTNEIAGTPRLNQLESAADANAIGLIVKGRDSFGDLRGWTYVGGGNYDPDRDAESVLSRAVLLALASTGSELTFTAVLEGCETRLGIDRDEDGFLDRDERDGGSDPADPNSTPGTSSVGDDDLTAQVGLIAAPNPVRFAPLRLEFSVEQASSVRLDVFDIQGRRVRSLMTNEVLPAGTHSATWDLRDENGRLMSQGIYFVRVLSPSFTLSQRVMVTR
ncbi:MAG: T9SS type A sorting domain-containing protein, partial [Candidatus Eisenbacteria bacterium]|nr:T9SS type A sorting domain-containing protein [Candidatus Eisenbacteria bacterium]